MEDQTPEQQPERRPWMRRTVTLAAAGALTAGAAAIAVPALASETTPPTPTPSSGYTTEESAPEGQSGSGARRDHGDCPDGAPGFGEGRGPRPPGERGNEDGPTQAPEAPESPSSEGSAATSDA